MWKIFLFSGGKSSGGGYQKVTVPVYPKVYSPELVFHCSFTLSQKQRQRSLFGDRCRCFLQGLFLQPLFSLFLPQSPVDQVSAPPSRVKSWVVEASTIS